MSLHVDTVSYDVEDGSCGGLHVEDGSLWMLCCLGLMMEHCMWLQISFLLDVFSSSLFRLWKTKRKRKKKKNVHTKFKEQGHFWLWIPENVRKETIFRFTSECTTLHFTKSDFLSSFSKHSDFSHYHILQGMMGNELPSLHTMLTVVLKRLV